ncbi:hypothetical protein SJI18_18710 [Clostridium frigoriphilum]|uniref:Uncharacterized protein n=1 Tax=Clostridium frigoriphilum TaxID=443253 RepID=A0ABU7USH6_9CLOT
MTIPVNPFTIALANLVALYLLQSVLASQKNGSIKIATAFVYLSIYKLGLEMLPLLVNRNPAICALILSA